MAGDDDVKDKPLVDETTRLPDWMSWLLIHQVLFTLTGVTKTIGNQQVAYLSSNLGWVFFNGAVSTVGPVFIPIYMRGISNLVPSRQEFETSLIAAVLDAVGIVLSVLGMQYAGSGLMSVIYASLPAMTAVLRYFWMSKSLSRARVMCVATVMVGLSIVPLTEGFNLHSDSQLMMLGLVASFASTMSYAVLYVSVEKRMLEVREHEGSVPIDPLRLIFWQAVVAVGFLLMGFVVHESLFYERATMPDFTIHLMGSVLLLIVSSASHSYSWVKLIDWSGSTGTGLLQGARSSLSLLSSALLFCDATHQAQCLTIEKVSSALLVLGGVYMFNRNK